MITNHHCSTYFSCWCLRLCATESEIFQRLTIDHIFARKQIIICSFSTLDFHSLKCRDSIKCELNEVEVSAVCVCECVCVCHQVSCSYFDNNYHFNVTHFPPLWPIEKENRSSDVSGLAEYIHIFNISASKTGHLNLVLCVVAVHAHVNVGNVIPCHKLTWKECDPEKIHHLL